MMPVFVQTPFQSMYSDPPNSLTHLAYPIDEVRWGVRPQKRIIIQNLTTLTRPADVALFSLHRSFRELTLLERRRPMTMINQLLKVKGHDYFSWHS